MNSCLVCGQGTLYQVRGRLYCTNCTRRKCSECHRPILRSQSMQSDGRGDRHHGGCPGTGDGIKIFVASAQPARAMEMVDQGFR